MKKTTTTIICQHCNEEKKEKDIYRLSYRYTDKTKTYRNSQTKWIHTGYKFVCKKCLKLLIK